MIIELGTVLDESINEQNLFESLMALLLSVDH